MKREALLHAAEKLINGPRAKDYGDALHNHKRIAAGWNVIVEGAMTSHGFLTPAHVALMMDWVKTSRLVESIDHEDSWIDKAGYTALGTERKLYLYSEGVAYDITPIRLEAALTNPFTTNATTTVTVAHTSHGASVGDFVTFDSFSAIDGLDMNKEFEITTVVNANSYKVTHTSQASGSTSGGGGTGNAKYQISVGVAGANGITYGGDNANGVGANGADSYNGNVAGGAGGDAGNGGGY